MTTQLLTKMDAGADARLKKVLSAVNKHNRRPDALIEVLHTVQDAYGYVPKDLMKVIAKEMRIAPSKILGVVTFYHFFSLKPRGEHNCLVCTGTACHVKGAGHILVALEKELGLKPGQTTPDGKLGLQTARCLGCCGLAPVLVLDDQIIPRGKPDEAVNFLKLKIGEAHANRSA